MKIIGILLINIVCTVTGIYFAYKTKERCETARQLLQMADMMAVELSFSADNSRKIVNRLRKEKSLSRLFFLNDIDFENINIKTGLDPADDHAAAYPLAGRKPAVGNTAASYQRQRKGEIHSAEQKLSGGSGVYLS